VKKNAK